MLWCFTGTRTQGLETSAGWLTGCPRSTHVSVTGLSHYLQHPGVHVGLVPPIQQLWGFFCFPTSTAWFNPHFKQEKGFPQTSTHLNRVFSGFPTLVLLEAMCVMRE